MLNLDRNYYFKAILWIVLVLFVLWFLSKIHNTLIVFVLAALIAYLLNPFICFFSNIKPPFYKKNIPRFTSIIIVYAIILIITILISTILIPVIIKQTNNLIDMIPASLTKIQEHAGKVQIKYYKLPLQIKENLQNIFTQGFTKIGELLIRFFNLLANFIFNIISGIFLIITALIIALFLLLRWDEIKKRLSNYIPPIYKEEIVNLIQELNNIFGGFLKGILILSLATFILNWIIFIVLGLIIPSFNFSLIISFLNGITYGIPIIGVLFSSLLGGFLGYIQTNSLSYAFTIFFAVMITNKMIDQFLCPKVISDTMGVSPLFVIFAAFAGGELLGFWGLILGVPMAAMLKTIFNYIHRRFLVSNP